VRRGQTRLLAIAIALTFLGGVLALAFPREKKEQFRVTAYFTKAIGLFPESRVRVLGVSVGRVSSVEAVGSKVKVVMRLDPEIKVPADARAVIVPISLISDRYVQLTPVYTSGARLRNGDVIDTDRTVIPAELDDLLAQLKKFLDAVQAGSRENPESLGLAVKNLAAALAGAGDGLSKTLSGGGALAGAASANAAQLDAIVGELSRLFGALSDRRNDIALLNSRLAQALGAVASESDSLNGALSNLALLTEQLNSLVAAHRPNLEADLTVLAKTTKILTDRQESTIQALDWLHVLADGAENAHEGGALHVDAPVPHIDVRDAHLFPCPPAIPPAVCLLLGLTGGGLSLSASTPGAVGSGSAASPAPGQPATPAPSLAPDPGNLLDLLPKVGPLLPSSERSGASAPSLRGFFSRMGGLLDNGWRWLSW
jgi:virulence factor Mce-like protein